MHRTTTNLLALAWTVTFLAGPAVSLLRADDESAGQPEAAAATAQPAGDAAHGRLPNFFAKIVTDTQRTQIYAIHEQYASQIKQLQDTLKALTDKRDAAVIAVLTADQRQAVEKLKTEAQARRKQKADEARDAAKSAAATPADMNNQ